jgi:hypothetical protein
MQLVDDQVVVATHGRGIFTATLDASLVDKTPPIVENTGVSFKGELLIVSTLASVFDSTVIRIDDQRAGSYGPNGTGQLITSISGLPPGDTVTIELVGYSDGEAYASGKSKGFVFDVKAPVSTYVQDFNRDTDDFATFGFQVRQEDGFSNQALHTIHPYPEGIFFPGGEHNLLSQLKVPLIVTGTNPTITYKDIALVEPGDPNNSYPSERFKDYVVVEATDDGLNWRSLAVGYDARNSLAWNELYNSGGVPDEDLYVDHELNLKSIFQEGDTVFIRYRLFSNEATAGWGWVVDDLVIQNKITAVEQEEISPSMDLHVYPNPAQNMVTLTFNLNEASDTHISLLDVNGRMAWNRTIHMLMPGSHTLSIDGSSIMQGLYILELNTNGRTETTKVVFR